MASNGPPPPYQSENVGARPVDMKQFDIKPTASTNQAPSVQNDKIHIIITNPQRNPVIFNYSRTKSLGHIMKKYCDREGIIKEEIRFLFDGKPVNDFSNVDEWLDEDEIDDTNFKFEMECVAGMSGGSPSF